MNRFLLAELSFLNDNERDELLKMILGVYLDNQLEFNRRKKSSLEDKKVNLSNPIIDILLLDRTTRENIIWGTESYMANGFEYYPFSHIDCSKIIGGFFDISIKKGAFKDKDSKKSRKKCKAEVFTQSWTCNEMINVIDNLWFNRSNVFNIDNVKSWITNYNKIDFKSSGKKWKDYVLEKRIEITCGECPFLVSRYDTVTGKKIELKDRIGILDRKFRVINENVSSEKEWINYVYKAYESIYGYEFQGDNLLIGRLNLLLTFIEYLYDRYNRIPTKLELKNIATRISWNIWQMDGLTYKIPFFNKLDIKDIYLEEENNKYIGYCVINDWRSKVFKIFKNMEEVKAFDLWKK